MTRTEWLELHEALGQHATNQTFAAEAAERLINAVTASDLPDVYRLLSNDAAFMREVAAKAIAKIEGINALTLLMTEMRRCELGGFTNRVLSNIVIDLIADNPTKAVVELDNMLQLISPQVRKDATWGLGQLPIELAMPRLMLTMKDDHPDVRASSAIALKNFKDEWAIVALAQLVRDPIEKVRVAAAVSLSHNTSRLALLALESALSDPAEVVRLFARQALTRAGGMSPQSSSIKISVWQSLQMKLQSKFR